MRPLTTTAVLLTLTAMACDAGGDESAARNAARDSLDARASTARSACALVDEAQLERTLAFDVVMTDNTTGSCIATAADGSPGAPTVDFRIEPRTAAFDYVAAHADAVQIDDLGERAVWATENDITGTLAAVTGTRVIVVVIGDADGVGEQSRRHAQAVARMLLGVTADVRP